MNNKAKPVRSKEQIPSHCTLCGNCCRDVEDQVMLELPDAYHLGRYLREHGVVQSIEDVFARYTHPIMLEDLFPVFMLNTTGEDYSCIFLQGNRCSVYEARPQVCRNYPFTVLYGEKGKRFSFLQCLDQHASHFQGSPVEVGQWMYRNFSKDARAFMEADGIYLPQLGRLLQQMSEKEREASLFHLLYYRYYNYDLDEPLLAQYERNQRALLTELRRRLNRK